MLFTYWPKEGQERAFFDGYRKHLDWHRENEDPIMWYAWNVVVGPRAGLFIDGAFDIAFEALDQRVKPREDRADFEATSASFASVNDRVLYRLRADLSTDTPLEDRHPSAMVRAFHYRLAPGHETDFESALRGMRDASSTDFTVYEVVAGADHPQFLILEQHATWADLGKDSGGFGYAASGSAGVDKESLVSGFQKSVASIESEVWLYRADLTYMPP